MTIKETKLKIVDDLNQSGLAIDVMELILENILNAVHQQVEIAYERDAAEKAKKQDDDSETVPIDTE